MAASGVRRGAGDLQLGARGARPAPGPRPLRIPKSAAESLRNLEDLAAPVGAFLRECCIVDPAFEVAKDTLWVAWKDWCTEEGHSRPGTKAVFARDLHAAVPFLASIRPAPSGPLARLARRHVETTIRIVVGFVAGRRPLLENASATTRPSAIVRDDACDFGVSTRPRT